MTSEDDRGEGKQNMSDRLYFSNPAERVGKVDGGER